MLLCVLLLVVKSVEMVFVCVGCDVCVDDDDVDGVNDGDGCVDGVCVDGMLMCMVWCVGVWCELGKILSRRRLITG